jgi:hypothetical protein
MIVRKLMMYVRNGGLQCQKIVRIGRRDNNWFVLKLKQT